MIKANELRIGNLVLFTPNKKISRVVIVDSIKKDLIVTKDGRLDLPLSFDSVSPIPLTPELLGKMLTKVSSREFIIEIPVEWSKTHHTDVWFVVKWYEWIATGESHKGWRPYIQRPRPYPQVKELPELEEIFLWGYLETVHQLQNFYFAITNSELNIKQ